jgi:glycosyltransferase involved in cell wall biosynthesis
MKGPRIFVDLRPLQDQNYKYRGVGFLISSVLRARRCTAAANFEFVGLINPDCEPLPNEYAALVDAVSGCWNPVVSSEGGVFLSGSPMTADPSLVSRFLNQPGFVSAAIVYDFIPLDRSGYFPHLSDEIEYFAKLASLRQYDFFTPISEYSAKRLREILGVPSKAIRVIGAPVRAVFSDFAAQLASGSDYTSGPYFLSVGGGDRRKNTEAAVEAVWRLRLLTGEPFRLKVVGHYSPDYRNDLVAVAALGGADPSFLEFHAGVDDTELARLYAEAVATIAPSHIEGFSIPVAEASACGSPVIASTCAAHLELIDHPEALFPSYDAAALADRLIAIWKDADLRKNILQSQAGIRSRFREEAVAERLWEFVLGRTATAKTMPPMVSRQALPRLAFLTPYPPEESGVARFSELTLQALHGQSVIDLYSEAPRPFDLPPHVHDAGPISHAVMRRGPYDAVISVLGNSHFHTAMFDFMEKYGGPCILHDSRLTHFYYWRLGSDGFRAWASRTLGRPVLLEEIERWLQDKDPPSLFIERIIARAAPLIVHTERFRDILDERYNIRAQVTTFPPNVNFCDEELSDSHQREVRKRLGISNESFAVGTFGYVSWVKGVAPLVVAAELLRAWKIPIELFIIGCSEDIGASVIRIAREFGNAEHVHILGRLGDAQCRDYLLALDAAVQLRTYDFGQPSAALADCISAALPTVANASLADSCDAPDYVSRVDDHLSPLLIAERLADIRQDRKRESTRVLEERRHYCEEHNFKRYAKLLLPALCLQ